jgi:hypothetical protein
MILSKKVVAKTVDKVLSSLRGVGAGIFTIFAGLLFIIEPQVLWKKWSISPKIKNVLARIFGFLIVVLGLLSIITRFFGLFK